MSKIHVSVSVDDAHLDRIQAVAENLQSAGMEVEQTLAITGVINGLIEEDQIEAISQVEGVQHVEPEREFQLPPPDSEVQ